MFTAIVEELAGLPFDKHDRATLRRWRAEDMTPGSPLMQRLSERINEELQRSHDRSEVSPLKKPDWV